MLSEKAITINKNKEKCKIIQKKQQIILNLFSY
nr:MAG TPA: hypothetical protein [Caudoviricetes sp.]